ncbi:oligosaccharide flippase family protein [Membranihabitans maritimus]|uniref:oligosaccharide flippase family protein n=1 Tax=Membranihabitans maritimus TaxID=2904244 RepID=UPI001F018632|nr:oligosaccharide flippase family protein [Membranihabitans maritimus]
MNSIKRQSLKTFIVEGLGIFIGFFSLLFIYPLGDEIFGYMQFLYSSGNLLIPILGMGIPVALLKFIPYEVQEDKNRFLIKMVIYSFITTLIFVLLFLSFKKYIYHNLDKLDFDIALLQSNEKIIFFTGFVMVQSGILISFLSHFNRIATPSLIRDLGYKLVLPVTVLLFYFGWVPLEFGAKALLFFTIGVFITLLAYSIHQKFITFSLPQKSLKIDFSREILAFMLFSSLGSISSIIAFRIDVIMVGTLISLTGTALYSKILILSNVIEIPGRVLNKTLSPAISNAWSQNNTELIKKFYQNASVNMLAGGIYLFLVLWFIYDDLISISSNPQSFEGGKILFLVLGLGKLIDLATGINNAILGYSPSYKVNFIFILLLGSTNIVLNYFLIQRFDILGAAYSTFIAYLLFNTLKFIYLLVKYKLSPFSLPLMHLILLGAVTFLTLYFIDFGQVYINIIGKPVIISVLVFTGLFYFKISPEFIEICKTYYAKIGLRN